MGIGTGIVLIAIGLILLFAVDFDIPYITDDALGWILIIIGILGLLISLALMRQRAHTSHTARVEERRYDDTV